MYPLDNILLTLNLMLSKPWHLHVFRTRGGSFSSARQCANPGQHSPTAHSTSLAKEIRAGLRLTHIKTEPEEDSFLLGVQKPARAFLTFLSHFPVGDGPSGTADDKELNTLLKAMKPPNED